MPIQNQDQVLDEPQQKLLTDFSGGLNFNDPPTKLQDNQFTDIINLQYFRSQLRVDTGYTAYRQPVQGTAQAQFQFVQTNGGLQTLLLTTKYLYVDNGSQWQFLGDGLAGTTLQQATNAGGDSFELGTTANLVVGNPLGITLDDGSQLQTTIINISGDTVNTADPVPSGRVANIQAQIVRPMSLNGSLQFQPNAVTWAGTNQFILTNGVDPILSFDGNNLIALPGWGGITCRVLGVFHGFLLVADTTEGGERFPQRIRNSDEANPEQPNGQLGGLVDLTDTEDFILALETLGPWMIIYREENVMRRSYIGDPLELFFDEYMLQGIGVFSQGAVADTGSTHVIIGPEGIFRYSGGYDVEDVGEGIFDYILGPEGVLNTSATSTIFTVYVAELDEVWLFIPTSNSATPNILLRYDQGDESWFKRQFANSIIGFGYIDAVAGRSWQQATETWQQDTSTWLARSKQVEAPLVILCDAITGQTWLYDYLSTTDGGAVILWSLTTKDFQTPGFLSRFDGVAAQGQGNNVEVDVSFDRGVSWQSIGTLNFGLTPTKQKVNNQFVGDSFRVRLSGSDPTFRLDWMRIDWFKESDW